MDFSSINNLSDLIKANNEVKQPVENEFGRKVSPAIASVLKDIYALDPDQGLEIVMDVLTQLLVMHKVTAEEFSNQNAPALADAWSVDTGKLDAVISILSTIEM